MSKTIFNTSEKSNFIVNMTQEGVDKLLTICLCSLCVVIPLFSIFMEFVDGLYTFPYMGMLISGVFALIVILIMSAKKQFFKEQIMPITILSILLILGLVSALHSYSYEIAFNGQEGRGEGLIVIAFYAMFFVLAGMISKQSLIDRFFDFMVGMGIINCIFAVLQMFPFWTFSSYKNLNTFFLHNVCLPSGLTGNPVLLAALLTLVLGISLNGAFYDKNKKRRVIYTIASALFVFCGIRTSVIAGYVGIIGVIILSFVIYVVKKDKSAKKPLLKMLVMIAMVAASMVMVYFSPSINNTSKGVDDDKVYNGAYFYDGAVAWQDSYFRLGTSGLYVYGDDEYSITKPYEFYKNIWGITGDIIKENPMLGAGVECMVFPQMKSSLEITKNVNTFDKPYNDFLYIAATRGIPSLIIYLLLIVICLRKMIKNIRDSKSQWTDTAVLISCVVYILVSSFSFSSITAAPFFWILMGMAFCRRTQKLG